VRSSRANISRRAGYSNVVSTKTPPESRTSQEHPSSTVISSETSAFKYLRHCDLSLQSPRSSASFPGGRTRISPPSFRRILLVCNGFLGEAVRMAGPFFTRYSIHSTLLTFSGRSTTSSFRREFWSSSPANVPY
jgi:hypothetical protein